MKRVINLHAGFILWKICGDTGLHFSVPKIKNCTNEGAESSHS